MSLADTVTVNDIAAGGDRFNATRGTTATATVELTTTNGDPAGDTNGCNATGGEPLNVTLNDSATGDLTFSTNPVVITGCGVPQTSSYTVSNTASLGRHEVSTSTSGGRTDGTRLYNTSDKLIVTVAPRPAKTPVSAVAGPGSVSLSWGASDDHNDLTDYVIARTKTGDPTGNATLDTADGSGATSFVDSGLQAGAEYCYSVRARYVDASSTAYLSTSLSLGCATVAPLNRAPTADAGGPYTGSNEGTPVQLDGTATDADNDTLDLHWTATPQSGVDAGASCSFSDATAIDPTVTCTDDGTWTLTLSADDGTAAPVTDTASLVLGNANPTASITGAPASSPEGTGITLGSSVTDPGTNDTHTRAWSVTKNGTAYSSGSGASFSFTPDDNGSYVVTLTATDDNGGADTDTATITVTNVDPTATITGAPTSSSPEGTAISLGSTITDPGSADTLTRAWSVTKNGDAYGSGGSGTTFSFTPDDNGTYVVTLVGTDDDGGSDTDTVTITVTNALPSVGTLNITGGTGAACIAGNQVSLSFSFSDAGTNDGPWAIDVDWGDGSEHGSDSVTSQGSTGPYTHSYGAGSYVISVTVTDKDSGGGSRSSTAGAVSHLYSMSGILAPFNADGSSVWKYGSTLPVKVAITDCNNQPVPNLKPKVGTSLVSSNDPTIAIDEVASTSAADTTGFLRYSDPQYIYNFASKNLSDPSATYWMTVKGTGADGTTIVTSPAMVQVKFGLKTK